MKGRIPWNKGLKGVQVAWNKGLTKETDGRVKLYSEKRNKAMIENNSYGGKLGKHYLNGSLSKLGDKNPQWKGENARYRAIHVWIRKYKPKPEFCEICHINLAKQISCNTIYKRDISCFDWLCIPCHIKRDNNKNNNIEKYGWKDLSKMR